MAAELARDLIRTQDQLGPRDTEMLVFKLFNQQMPKVHGTSKIEGTNIGHAYVVGHATNGRIGTTYLGVDGEQITLGTEGLGATSTTRVVSLENAFVEALRDTTYVDTDNTSATVDTATHKITF